MTTTAVALAPPEVVSARDEGALPWVRLDGAPGVRVRTLFESPTSRSVVLLLDRGAEVPMHVHPQDDHHAYVLEGRCRFGDRVLDTGSYVHVAAGTPHDLRGEYPWGTKVLYVIERGPR
jgi:quercetin dioxygenase-like cupin family protein